MMRRGHGGSSARHGALRYIQERLLTMSILKTIEKFADQFGSVLMLLATALLTGAMAMIGG